MAVTKGRAKIPDAGIHGRARDLHMKDEAGGQVEVYGTRGVDYIEGPSGCIDAPAVEQVGAVVLPEARVASVHV